jgi:hypothetical protein
VIVFEIVSAQGYYWKTLELQQHQQQGDWMELFSWMRMPSVLESLNNFVHSKD